MDSAESAERAHNSARPPLRSLCPQPPPEQPGSEGFWRPWLRTPSEKEERVEPHAAEALPSGPGVTEVSRKLSQYRHPVRSGPPGQINSGQILKILRLFWPKSKCYDYLYQEAETLLKNFPIQATISFYEDSDSEDEIEGLACENQSN